MLVDRPAPLPGGSRPTLQQLRYWWAWDQRRWPQMGGPLVLPRSCLDGVPCKLGMNDALHSGGSGVVRCTFEANFLVDFIEGTSFSGSVNCIPVVFARVVPVLPQSFPDVGEKLTVQSSGLSLICHVANPCKGRGRGRGHQTTNWWCLVDWCVMLAYPGEAFVFVCIQVRVMAGMPC